VNSRSFFQLLSAKKQSVWEFVLASGHTLLHRGHAVTKDIAGGLRKKEIVSRSTARIEEGVQICIRRWRSGIGSLTWKIPIEVYVVFVPSPQPRHPIWIEDVDDN